MATENIVMIPRMVPLQKAQEFADWLKVKLAYTSISGSVLAGALVCANSNGMLVSQRYSRRRISGDKIGFRRKHHRHGNQKNRLRQPVLASDKGAVVDPRFKETEIKKISEALGVEAVPTEIAGLPYVGSLAVATNKGVLGTPIAEG